MTAYRIRKTLIISAAVIGIVINSHYGIEMLREFFSPQTNDTMRDVLISAIALEFGWAALLIWMIFRPFARCHLLLFTAIAMMLGNLFQSINKFMYFDESPGAVALNLAGGFLFAGVFVFAFFVGKQEKSENQNNCEIPNDR